MAQMNSASGSRARHTSGALLTETGLQKVSRQTMTEKLKLNE